MSGPHVTVVVPLYRSRPFLASLRRNLRALASEEDITVVVSDRHVLDDTVDVLRNEWGTDPRFRFVKAHDQLNWVDHLNRLLIEAGGEYVRWLPHDDFFPPGCLKPLVRRLDSDPDALLAYGPTRGLDSAGARWPQRDRLNTYPVPAGGRWTLRHSLDLFWRGYCDGGFKGLFRRCSIVDAGLLIRPTRDLIHAERAWLFAVSLLGGVVEEPHSEYYKRFHPDSVSANWKPGARHVVSTTATMCGYLRDFGPAGIPGVKGVMYHWARAALYIMNQARSS